MPTNRQLADQEAKQVKTAKLPFRGGINTRLEDEQLESGGYSEAQNIRNTHPGIIKRPGQQRINSTAEGSTIATMFQFSKGKKSEKHFYAQCGLNIIEADSIPPASITGSLGSVVFTQAASSQPAAWTIITDKMLFANGVNIAQIYPGNDTPIDKFMICKDTAEHPMMPEKGVDYSLEVIDDDTSQKAVLNSIGTIDEYDAIYIMSPMPIYSLGFTMGNKNSTSAVASIDYWNNEWLSITSVVNNTSVGGCAFGSDGTMTWTPPSGEITKHMYGTNGFWYRLYLVSGSTSGLVDTTHVTYKASFQPIQNVWNGTPANPVEVQYFRASNSNYLTQSPDGLIISSMDPSDVVYIATIDPVEALYVNVGVTPNSHATTLKEINYNNGASWNSVSNLTDATDGFRRSGWITFKRHTDAQTTQFGNLLNYAYWYNLATSGNSTSSNLVIGITAQPFFNIADLGKCINVIGWKNRACYVFERTPNFMHVSETNQPLCINGDDYAILRAGDGRSNKIVCLKNFYNELMAWQEEKGVEGGSLTLFDGYTPKNFGSTILSHKVGTFSPKSAVVVDGILTSTATDEQIKTIAYFISHYGIFATDGRVVWGVSDDISNYFNPTKTQCIRYGYEDKMWIGYDSAFNVLRVGLVSGASATECNVFLVYDLVDKTWSIDSLGQSLNSFLELESGTSNTPVLQVGGGQDGFLYKLNNSQNDVSTAINTYVKIELNLNGNEFMLKDMKLRHKVQTAGNISVIPYQNGVEKASFTITMTAENTSETIRRSKKTLDLLGTHLALKIGNASATNDMTLYDLALNLENFDDR